MATNAAELVKRAFQGFKPVAKSDPKSPGVVEIDAAKVAEELQKAAHAFSGDGDLDALEKSIDVVESLLAKAADDPTTGVILAPASDIAKRFAKDKVEAPAAPVEKAVTPPAPAAPAPAVSPTPAAPAAAPVAKAGEVTPPPAAAKPAESAGATPATGKKTTVKKAAEVRWGSDLAAELSDIKKAKGKGKKAAPPEEEEMADEDEGECDEDALAKDAATSTEQPAATPTAKAEAAPSAEGAETPTTKAADVEWSGDLSAERGNSGPRSQTRLQKVADAVGAASKGRAAARPRPSSALSPDQIAYELQRKSTSREKVRKARIKELKGKGYEPGMGYQPGLVEGVDTRDSGKPLETAGN